MGTHGSRAALPQHALTATGPLIGFVVRRNWIRLAAWWAFVVLMFAYVVSYYHATLDSQDLLDDFASVAAAPSMRALTGVAAEPATMGGAVWTKIWMTLSLGLAFGMVFLVTRNARAEEESGRGELVRARMVGIHSQSVATWVVASVVCLLAGIATAVVSLAAGLDPAGSGTSGSWLMGLSIGAMGLLGVAVSAVAGQVTLTSRGANALASAVIGVFYAMRVVGDLGNGALTWASPVGWGQETSPYGHNRWWALLLLVGFSVVLLAGALALEGRRDFGAGMLPERPGRTGAPTRWTSPAGLAVRMERAAWIGWGVVVVVAAVIFGSVMQSMQDLLGDLPPEVAARIGAGSTDSLAAFLVREIALVVLVFAMQATLPLRTEESSGRLEIQLSRSLARWRWVLGRMFVPVLGSLVLLAVGGAVFGMAWDAVAGGGHLMQMLGATVVYWPATMVMVALALAAFACVPRISVALTWLLVAAGWVVEVLGTTTDVPQTVWEALPFGATPMLPSESMDWAPTGALTLVALGVGAFAVVVFSRRDLQTD